MPSQRSLIQWLTVFDRGGIWLAVGPRSGTCGPKEVPDEPLDGDWYCGRIDIRGAGDRARAARQFIPRRLVDARVEHAHDQTAARREHAQDVGDDDHEVAYLE